MTNIPNEKLDCMLCEKKDANKYKIELALASEASEKELNELKLNLERIKKQRILISVLGIFYIKSSIILIF